MGVTATGLGLLYSQLFQTNVNVFLPYITTGFIVWNFVMGCLTEGTDTFIANEGLIKHLPAPLTVYALRTVWRQTLMFLHNLLVYLIILVIFWGALSEPYTIKDGGVPQPGVDLSSLLAIPGFALLALNAGWVVLLFGIASTRFRDIPQVVTSLSSLLFFMTPIVWSVDILYQRLHSTKTYVYKLNPFYHFMEIVRAPLLGMQQHWHHWAVAGFFAVVGWSVTLVVLRKYRSRVSYWV